MRSTYDPSGGLQAISIEGHEPLTFERDATGRELQRRSRNGFVLDHSFDAVGQLVSQAAGRGLIGSRGSTSQMFEAQVQRDFKWSKAFESTSINDARWGLSKLSFDGRGQVLSADYPDGDGERFAYDAAMNIEASSVEKGAPPLALHGGRPRQSRARTVRRARRGHA